MILTTNNFFYSWKIIKYSPLPDFYRGGGQALYINNNVILPIQPLTKEYGEKIEFYIIDNNLNFKKEFELNPPKKALGIHHISYYDNIFFADLKWLKN